MSCRSSATRHREALRLSTADRPCATASRLSAICARDRQARLHVFCMRLLSLGRHQRDGLAWRLGEQTPIINTRRSGKRPNPPPAPRRAEADCGDSGCGGRLAGQAPRVPRPARHPPPIHLPRHVRRPRHQSDGVGGDARSANSCERSQMARTAPSSKDRSTARRRFRMLERRRRTIDRSTSSVDTPTYDHEDRSAKHAASMPRRLLLMRDRRERLARCAMVPEIRCTASSTADRCIIA